MKFNPKAGLLADGEYDATIVSAEDKLSKKGNPMMELIVRCYGISGQEVEVMDWLMESQGWKLQSLCQSVGHDFESGNIEPYMLQDRSVRVRLVTQKDDKYGERNRISAYVGPAAVTLKPETDPDIPFD